MELNLGEFNKIRGVISDLKFDTIFYFAGSIVVSESVMNPLKYYMNNTADTINLIDCAVNANIKRFIFSSTAAVYGEPPDVSSNGINEQFKQTQSIHTA